MKVTYSRHGTPVILSRLSAVPLIPALLLVGTGLALTLVIDLRTGEAPVQHVYYIPLIFAALRFGATGGLLTAVAAILLYHVVDIRFSAANTHADFLQTFIFIGVPLVTAKLADDARRLRQLASTDDLTGLANLRGFEVQLASLIHDSRARSGPVSMLVLDLDGLKSLNDCHGHLAGADAVRTVGRIIADHLPSGAAACRYGGDEFAIAASCDVTDATRFGEDLVRRVQQTAPVLAGKRMRGGTLSVSIGIASRVFQAGERANDQADADGEALFRAADRALYVAKLNGKGRTVVAE